MNVTAFGSTSDHLVELSKTVKTPLKTLCEVASGAFFNVQIDFQGVEAGVRHPLPPIFACLK